MLSCWCNRQTTHFHFVVFHELKAQWVLVVQHFCHFTALSLSCRFSNLTAKWPKIVIMKFYVYFMFMFIYVYRFLYVWVIQRVHIRLVSAWQTEDAWERLLVRSVDAVRPSVISETLALGRCLTDVFPTPIPNKPPSAPHTTSFHLCAQCVCILFLWGHRGVWQCSSHAAKCEKCDWPTFGYYGYQRPYIAEWRVWKLAKNRSLILTHEEGRRSWCVYTLNYILDDGLKHHDSFPLFLYHL